VAHGRLEGRHDGLGHGHGHARIGLVLGLDEVPPGPLVVGVLEHVLHRHLVEWPLAAIAPVLLGDLPFLEGVTLAGLEAPHLLLGGDVEPELDDDRALFDRADSKSRISV